MSGEKFYMGVKLASLAALFSSSMCLKINLQEGFLLYILSKGARYLFGDKSMKKTPQLKMSTTALP